MPGAQCHDQFGTLNDRVNEVGNAHAEDPMMRRSNSKQKFESAKVLDVVIN